MGEAVNPGIRLETYVTAYYDLNHRPPGAKKGTIESRSEVPGEQ
jgi:hypothetical protein